MKKLLFAIAMLVCLHKINAQASKYHPFPESNAVWRVNSQGYTGAAGGVSCSFYQYTLGGDTIMGAYTYKKVYNSGFFYSCYGICGGIPPGGVYYASYCGPYGKGFKGGLRQDSINKKVYFNYGSSDALLYDFTKLVGDSVFIANVYVKINSIDSVLVGTNYHKRFNVSNSKNGTYPDAAIIEGVGATSGLLETLFVFEYSADLICFSHNSDIYPSGDTSCALITESSGVGIEKISRSNKHTLVYPNPTNGNFTIETNTAEKQSMQIYDVNGKLVLSQNISDKATIDASNLSEGVYNISITGNNTVSNKRLVIVK